MTVTTEPPRHRHGGNPPRLSRDILQDMVGRRDTPHLSAADDATLSVPARLDEWVRWGA